MEPLTTSSALQSSPLLPMTASARAPAETNLLVNVHSRNANEWRNNWSRKLRQSLRGWRFHLVNGSCCGGTAVDPSGAIDVHGSEFGYHVLTRSSKTRTSCYCFSVVARVSAVGIKWIVNRFDEYTHAHYGNDANARE